MTRPSRIIPKPLAGRRVVVTRPRDRATTLIAALEAAGATVLRIPAIETRPPDDPAPLDRAAAALERYDLVVLTSAAGARALAAAREAAGLRPPAVPCAAVGPATATALREAGFRVAVEPVDATGRALAAAAATARPLRGARVLLPRADIGLPDVADALRAAGAVVDEVVAYQTGAAASDVADPAALAAVRAGQADLVCLSSPSGVEGWGALAGAAAMRMPAVTIGPRTSAAARAAGFPVVGEADPHTASGMVAAAIRASTPEVPRAHQ